MSLFKKAERKRAKLRLALAGPSGSGKTHSALLIAAGLAPGGKVFVIDTEQGSADLEVGKPGIPDFFHARLDPPFTPERYIEYIHAAEDEGADVIIIDSSSHVWSGTGGVLEIHDQITRASSSKNSWAAWSDVTPRHRSFIDAILQSKCHVILTMRTKTAWEIIEEKGRKKPVKIGLKPDQRENFDYEVTLFLELAVESHIATASKDRTSIFDGKYFVPDVSTGEALRQWLEDGIDPKEISRREADALKAEADGHDSLQALEAWGRTILPRLGRLDPEHKQEVIAYCGSLKKQLGASAQAPAPATRPKETKPKQPGPVQEAPPAMNEEYGAQIDF